MKSIKTKFLTCITSMFLIVTSLQAQATNSIPINGDIQTDQNSSSLTIFCAFGPINPKLATRINVFFDHDMKNADIAVVTPHVADGYEAVGFVIYQSSTRYGRFLELVSTQNVGIARGVVGIMRIEIREHIYTPEPFTVIEASVFNSQNNENYNLRCNSF